MTIKALLTSGAFVVYIIRVKGCGSV